MQRNRREGRYNRARPVYPKPRLLYRQLLKQARRLEDPAARYFFQTQTRLRFRHSAGHSYSMVGSATQGRRDLKLNDAMYHLSRLTRANMGSGDDLEYVIGMTYGLIGPVISEREKYRSLLNFRPSNLRLYPLPEPNLEHSRKMEIIEGYKDAPLNPFHHKLSIPAQRRIKQIEQYKTDVLNDPFMASQHASEKTKTSSSIQSELASAPRLPSHLPPFTHTSPTTTTPPPPPPIAPLHDAFQSLDHLASNINPIQLSPYVYQPFRYGQKVVIPDSMSAENNAIGKRQSALYRFKKRLRRVWNPTNPVSTHQSDPLNPPHLSLTLLPDNDGSKPGTTAAQSQNYPLTIYSTRHPVHPRVQLSFEYQLDHFMYSILYFLSTRPASLRNAFRAWPDFGWVPLEQEAYDRIFGLKDSYQSDGSLKDPRQVIREHFGPALVGEQQPQSENASPEVTVFASELDIELNGQLYTLNETVLSDNQKEELAISLGSKRNHFLDQTRVIPSTLYSKLPVPKRIFDFVHNEPIKEM